MSKFLTELDLRIINDDLWKLDSPLIYESDLLECLIIVPKGFVTDLASVPRVPIAYWFWGGRAHREAVLHDFLFRIDAIPEATFMQANGVFLEAMEVRKKRWSIRYPMYFGVVAGGYCSYHKRKVDWDGS